MEVSPGSRQKVREPWTLEHIHHEHALALRLAIDKASFSSYNSALNSYITFCKIHKLPVEPTADTLSFFTIFMCYHIKPKSVDTYLSGICNWLEPFFPNTRVL